MPNLRTLDLCLISSLSTFVYLPSRCFPLSGVGSSWFRFGELVLVWSRSWPVSSRRGCRSFYFDFACTCDCYVTMHSTLYLHGTFYGIWPLCHFRYAFVCCCALFYFPLDHACLHSGFISEARFHTCMARFGFLTVHRVALCGFGLLFGRVSRDRTVEEGE